MLGTFIQSLPKNPYINKVQFKSLYNEYNEDNNQKSPRLASHLEVDLRGTQIYNHYKKISSKKKKEKAKFGLFQKALK